MTAQRVAAPRPAADRTTRRSIARQVGPRTKAAPFAGEQQRARAEAVQMVEGRGNIVGHLGRHRVQPVGSVERDRRDMVGEFELDRVEGGKGHGISSRGALPLRSRKVVAHLRGECKGGGRGQEGRMVSTGSGRSSQERGGGSPKVVAGHGRSRVTYKGEETP